VPKISTLTATLASMLCMLALFAVAAFAAQPPAGAGKPVKGRRAPQGVCFLHDLF
jgi:hypothetical protein